MILPFYYMLMVSLKVTYTAYNIDWFPTSPTAQNYLVVLFNTSFFRWFLNSIVVAGGATFFACFLSSMAGYAFAKKEFPGSKLLFILILTTMMIPFQITMIPLFTIFRNINWLNTYQGLIAPFLSSGFGVFLMTQFMKNIPTELIDAARIDGCSEFGTFCHVILPLSRAAITALAIFTFMLSWNNFLWPLVITASEEMQTITLGLATFQTNYLANYGLIMASATVGFLPILVFFLIFQKNFVQGITLSGLKA